MYVSMYDLSTTLKFTKYLPTYKPLTQTENSSVQSKCLPVAIIEQPIGNLQSGICSHQYHAISCYTGRKIKKKDITD